VDLPRMTGPFMCNHTNTQKQWYKKNKSVSAEYNMNDEHNDRYV